MSGPIDISIVIPAFNESKRLPRFLACVIAYCQSVDKTCEVIVVDDGSRDGTFEVASAFKPQFERLTVIR
ncbi:MAG: glycosyltransferase, partial [Candidatus Omnitrophica bacterium]|nr:glycosyltransferase [Candidatus Omnitrophota bacterium]